jgi:hypothetical protein
MFEPCQASNAADQIQADAITNQPAERNAVDEAIELELASQSKADTDDLYPKQADVRHFQDKTKDLESGVFHLPPFPHLNWQDTLPTHKLHAKETGENGDRRQRTNSTWQRSHSIANNGARGDHQIRYFDRGGAGRTQFMSAEPVSSEAADLARAEAASWAQMTPLLAATLGPLSVLLGIPTLTQRWRGIVLDPPLLPNGSSNFIELPDPPLNVTLAAICLFCEVMGNTLLVLRFSNFHTRVTTWVSYIFWMLKIVIGIANYVEFGIEHPQTNEIIYLQGFWVWLPPAQIPSY